MTADGSLDFPAWDRLLDFHLHEGTDGIVIAGTTGESPALSLEETRSLTRRAVERCAGKVKLIVGAGDQRDREHRGPDPRSVALGRRRSDAGDALLQ